MATDLLKRPLVARLPRSLSAMETWGFGLTGHVGWIGTAPIIHAALGPKAIFVWLPGVIVSVLLNLQVQRLGMHWPNIAGGTPNYAARLLNNFYGLGSYVAIGYFIGWVAAPAIYAIVLTDLIKVNIEPLGITCPEMLLKIGFIALAFIVGLSGTRALGILHLFFVIPAIGLLLAFCFQGLGWLAFSPNSPGLFPTSGSSLSFEEWAKWFFISTISVYSCETTSSFVADSRHPSETLRFLSWSAWLIPPVFLGSSWVLMQLATMPGMGDNLYLNLLVAARPFWGQSASFLVTLLIAFCCLLSAATAVANTSRILYQLALDGQLSPLFTVVSQRGVLEPALILTFILSLLCLAWGDISHVVVVAGTSYLTSIMGLHLGLWLRRSEQQVLFPWWSLAFFLVEAVVLVMGGVAWGWYDLLLGIVLPVFILMGDELLRRIQFAPFHPQWWQRRYYAKPSSKNQDFIMLQVLVLVLLICSSTTIGWVISGKLDRTANSESSDALLAVLLVTLSFVGIGIACWTTLPQIAAIDEARQQAKNIFITTLDTVPDTILVLDERGTIRQANPAAKELFQVNTQHLLGYGLNKFFSNLAGRPEQWLNRSEHTLEGYQSLRIIELTISRPSILNFQEYVVIVRDITERKQAEVNIRDALAKLEKLNEDLQRSNQELEQFAYVASHDLQEPLRAVTGYTQLLVQDYEHLLDESALEYTGYIVDGAKRMQQLIQDLLIYSRVGTYDLKLGATDCNTVLSQVLNNLQVTIAESNAIITQDPLPTVVADKSQVMQLFQNLIGNAIKFCREETPKIHISAVRGDGKTECREGYTPLTNEWIFTIRDNGIGIKPQYLERIFEIFKRLHTRREFPGTGIGLAICKKIIERHRGHIWVESQLKSGTTFYFTLPHYENSDV